MAKVEYAVDVLDLSGTDGRLNSFLLLKHLRDFGEEGWELVSLTLNIDLAEQGPATSWPSSAWLERPGLSASAAAVARMSVRFAVSRCARGGARGFAVPGCPAEPRWLSDL